MLANLPKNYLLALLLTLTPFTGQAELFKWVDEDGNPHYTDKLPAGKSGEKVTSGVSTSTYSTRPTSTAKPILRSYEKTVRKLHLPDTRYLWKSEAEVTQSQKIGIYHIGKGCTPRGAMKAPEVFIRHPHMFPEEALLSGRISKVIKELGYEAERTKINRLPGRLTQTGGLSLHSEIIAMDLNACAPGTRNDERLKTVEEISPHRFTRNRVQLEVRWLLLDNGDQDIIYQSITAGNYNGLKQYSTASSSVGSAVEDATSELFSSASFIAHLTADAETEDAGLADNLLSFLQTDEPQSIESAQGDQYRLQAHAAQAFSELNVLKIGVLQHYAMQGEWPHSLANIGYSELMFDGSEAIAHVSLQSDGSLIAELKELFGVGKHITLSPQITDGNFNMNRWHCSSNLEPLYLPQNCASQ